MKIDPISRKGASPAGFGEPEAAPTREGARGRLGKLALAVGVFLAIVGGWFGISYELERHSPLPNGGIAGEKCGLWFVGSSSMHKWVTLGADMLPWQTHNRGVDGAMLGYLTDRFASDGDVPPPRAIVFYGGENDLAAGASVADTLAHIERLVALKRQKYGALPMFIVSLKPSPTRWRFFPQQTELNRALATLAAGSRDTTFVNIVPLMLVDRRPGPFYQADGIHLSHEGYRRWGRAVRRVMDRTLDPGLVRACERGGERG